MGLRYAPNLKIRRFKETDFYSICEWWKAWGEEPPLLGMMIKDGTFVVEYDEIPVMTLTAFKTQSKEISYLEGFCRSPKLDPAESKRLGSLLWNVAFQYLKDEGFKRVICFANKESLKNRYIELGMHETLGGLTALGREL